MPFGTGGYVSPLGDNDELRDRIADAIRLSMPRPVALPAWAALSERKKNKWRYAADRSIEVLTTSGVDAPFSLTGFSVTDAHT